MPFHNRIAEIEIYEVSLAYAQAKTWTIGGAESESHYVVLRLIDDRGREGAAEVVCKPAWNGVTQSVLALALEEIAWPLLQTADADDVAAGAKIGQGVAGTLALPSLIDNAWRDLHWRGKGIVRIANAAVLNRDEPEAMASAASRAVFERGCEALKVKIGQGQEIDARVLKLIRRAVGDEVMLTVDANSAYNANDMPTLDALMVRHGVAFLEDPCPLLPNAAAEGAIRERQVPVLVDRAATSHAMAAAFSERGAAYFSAKPSRIGLSEAERIATLAGQLNGGICIGTYAESALGSQQQARLAASLAGQSVLLSAELDFHRDLVDDFLVETPSFEDGAVVVDRSRKLAFLVDWDKLERLARSKLALERAAHRKLQ